MNPSCNRICSLEDRVERGEHAHLCKQCGCCWHHTDELAFDVAITLDDYRAAHRCPECGREEREKYWPHEPTFEHVIDALAISLGIDPREF